MLRARAIARAGKAVGCTMGCLLIGALLGSLLNTWLRVDIVPLGVRAVRAPSAGSASTRSSHTQLMRALLSWCSPGGVTAELRLAWRARGRVHHRRVRSRSHLPHLRRRSAASCVAGVLVRRSRLMAGSWAPRLCSLGAQELAAPRGLTKADLPSMESGTAGTHGGMAAHWRARSALLCENAPAAVAPYGSAGVWWWWWRAPHHQ